MEESEQQYYARLACCRIPPLSMEIIARILAHIPTSPITHYTARTVLKSPFIPFPPMLHRQMESFPHFEILKLLQISFKLDLHLQVGLDVYMYIWESDASIKELCDKFSLISSDSGGLITVKQISLSVRDEAQMLQLLDSLTLCYTSIEKLRLRSFLQVSAGGPSGQLRAALKGVIGLEPKELTVNCFLLVSLSGIAPFRSVISLTLEDSYSQFRELLQHVANSMPFLSYLNIYAVMPNELSAPRLSLEVDEDTVELQSLRSLRTHINFLKYFTRCSGVEVLGLKIGYFAHTIRAEEVIYAVADAFKELKFVELKDDIVSRML